MTAPTLIDRRDAKRVVAIAQELCVSTETVPVGDGRYLTAAPVWFVLALLSASGNTPADEVLVVIDRAHLARLREAAGLRTVDAELRAVQEATAWRQERQAEHAASLGASEARRQPGPMSVRDVRTAKATLGMTTEQLARALGVSTFAVANWLKSNGHPPNAENAAAIRQLLAGGVSVRGDPRHRVGSPRSARTGACAQGDQEPGRGAYGTPGRRS